MPRVEFGINPVTGLSGLASKAALERDAINKQTSAAILAGFDYEVAGESLHFSYDIYDQQNFADSANLCLMLKNSAENAPDSVLWNAYRQDGSQVQLEFAPDDFLALYARGALAHKAKCMAVGAAKKAALLASLQEK